MLKKMLEILTVGVVVALVVGLYFRLAGALPVSVTQTQKMSTFDVMGEGRVVVVPDEASVVMGVRKEGSSVKQVQEQVNQTMTSLTKELKAMGIKDGDIRTSSYSFYPDYSVRGRYTAYAQVEVRIRDMEQVSPVLDLVGTLGLENVSGPSFGLSDELKEESVKEARAKAIEEAKSKAQELAGLAGMNLGRIVNVQEGSYYPAQPYMMRDALPVAGGGVDMQKTETPVEAGSSEVSVNVTLSYETR
jgi:uncharacterized protein YggE